MADFNRLTTKAQQAIASAQRIAQEYHASEIDGEHLLAALLDDPEGTPAIVLRQIGVDVGSLAKQLDAKLKARASARAPRKPPQAMASL